MSIIIKCPNCHFSFALEDALTADQKEEMNKKTDELRKKMQDYVNKKTEEFNERELLLNESLAKREEILKQQHESALKKQKEEIETSIRKNIQDNVENQIKLLQQTLAENEEKLTQARLKELDFLKKEQLLKTKEDEIDITIQKQLLAGREEIREILRREEQEKTMLKEQEFQLRQKELEKQLDAQKKLVDEMKRKAEQGSMQLQGEVQEILLEEILKHSFPFDIIQEVGKGVKGADCIQTVRNRYGQEAGRIIYESKRTKEFSPEWVEKLKTDMRSQGADAAVIVSKALPKDIDKIGEKNGVFICSFGEVRAVAMLLRQGILKISELKNSQENKGDKMVMLYDYLTGTSFKEQWKAIREGFLQMKQSIQKERDAMERLWKAREKQLEKVLLNAVHIQGSIEGISGAEDVNLQLGEDADGTFLE